MNKKVRFIAGILVFASLSIFGCAKSHDGNVTVTFEGSDMENYKKAPDDSELHYYNTIKEAILSSEFDEDDRVDNVKKVAKVLEKDNECVVLFTSEINNLDCLVVYKLKIKKNKDNISYSTPYFSKIRAWAADKSLIQTTFKSSKKLETLKEKVKSDLLLNNNQGIYDIGDIPNKTAWGLWKDDSIEQLKIEGVSPTDVIELEMDGDEAYLWYYENLKLDLNNMDKLKVTTE